MEQIILTNGTYAKISVGENQKIFARQLVGPYLHHHKVSNIWDKHLSKFSESRLIRCPGTRGEIVSSPGHRQQIFKSGTVRLRTNGSFSFRGADIY